MGKIQRLALALFVLAWAALGAGAALSLWESTAGIFLSLLLLSFITFAVDLFNRKMRLELRGKVATAVVVMGLLLLFFAPAVQTIPSGGSTATTCNRNGCSEVYQFKSITNSLLCWGASYQYRPPPVSDLAFGINIGCIGFHHPPAELQRGRAYSGQ